jgi:tetratricopeptide (TPR) repeat protein
VNPQQPDGRDFDRDGRDGRNRPDWRDGRDGRGDRRDGRDGDGRADRDWGRGDGRRWNNNDWNNRWSNNWNNGWGWNNSGWNGRWNNRHRGWRNGFWGWNSYGYRPWWGGYGGYGGLSTVLSLGFGVGNYGYGYPYGYGYGGFGSPYGYGYGNTWGYGTWLNSGYYYNPYYSTPLTLGPTVIDYSQPLVQYTTVVEEPSAADEGYATDSDPNTVAAMADFDTARAAFQVGDYNAALDGVHRALERLPNDPALHEFRGLVLFAQGNYREAAATVHAVLADGPGWDWETMSALYPSVDVYTSQLRALEEFAVANPESADARFLLGYHYMTEGYTDAGLRQFQKVVALQPKDMLAQRIVESAMPETEATGAAASAQAAAAADAQANPAVEAPPAAAPTAAPADALPADSGVTLTMEQVTGSWSASHENGAKFALNLTGDGKFTWTYTEGEKTSTLEGTYSLSNDLLILEPAEAEPMVGRITDVGASGFRFRMVGAPREDQGLQFTK